MSELVIAVNRCCSFPPIPVDAITALPESERQKQDYLAQQQLLAQQRLLQQPMAHAAPGPSRGGPAPARMGQLQPTVANASTSQPRGVQGGSAQDARKQMRERHRSENPMLKKFAIVRPAGGAAAGASASSASAGNTAGAAAPPGPGAPAAPSVPPPVPSRDGDDPQAKRSRI